MQISKQAAQAIDAMEASRVQQAVDERTKRQITENQDAIEFWIATARHWHKRATFLEGVAQREKDTTTQAVTEMQAQAMERDHWKQRAEQNHGDTMAAERRSDAFSDILDALGRGWRMESYDGCAKWWRYDTDTLAALAKEAREWEQQQDAQPVGADCQPDPVMSRDDMIAFIEAAYSQGMPMQITGVHTLADAALQNEFELAHRFVTATNERREREAVQQAARTATEPCDCQAYPILGHETPHETQSGYNRLKHATGLIMQLPTDHDGRNTWLMNYAERNSLEEQKLIRANPALFDEPAQAFAVLQQKRGNWIVWEWDYQPGDMPATAIVEIKTRDNRTNILEASVIDWSQVAQYRIIQRDPGVDAEHAAKAD